VTRGAAYLTVALSSQESYLVKSVIY